MAVNDFSINTGTDVVDEPCPPEPDMVNHPPHYKLYDTDLEVLDVILMSMPAECRPYFLKSQVIKYIMRSEMKNGLEDLKKARFYLNKWIALESVKE